jgi:hypothetical protein
LPRPPWRKSARGVAVLGTHGAQVAEFRVRAVIPGTRISCTPRSAKLHQALDAVAPVADAAVQRHQDDLGVAQHLVDVQVDRGVVLHLHRVGQAQARVIVRQLLGRFGEQRQAGIAAAQDHQLGGVWPRSAMLSSDTKPPGWVLSRCMG